MNKYEIVYIFRSTLTAEELESKLQNFHSQLTRDAGQISAVEHWGKRQLAYPIDRNDNGYYVVAQFTAPPSVLPEFERALKLDATNPEARRFAAMFDQRPTSAVLLEDGEG